MGGNGKETQVDVDEETDLKLLYSLGCRGATKEWAESGKCTSTSVSHRRMSRAKSDSPMLPYLHMRASAEAHEVTCQC